MSDNKDFWSSSSNDDFWSKPVVTDDWLKNDSGSIWNSTETKNTDTDTISEEEKTDDFWSDFAKSSQEENKSGTVENPYIESNPYASQSTQSANPYVQQSVGVQDEQTSRASVQENPYANDWYVNPYENKAATSPQTKKQKYQTSSQVYAQVTGQEPVRKKKHVHTIICVCFLLLIVISWTAAIIGSSAIKKEAQQTVAHVSYQEERVKNNFTFGENNEVYLEDVAYTLVSEENFTGFPEGRKLIAVYVKVLSEDYVSDGYVFRDLYIGYENSLEGAEGVISYKTAAEENVVSPFIRTIGFDSTQILSIYGIGNGTNYEGYYFFFVPADVEKITLYAEQKRTEKEVRVLDRVYYKEMTVLQESEEITKELTERGTD